MEGRLLQKSLQPATGFLGLREALSTRILAPMDSRHFRHHFLIAMPTLKDSNFTRAVIYLYEHDDEGAMGLAINKPLDITLGNVLRHLDIEPTDKHAENAPVLMGGPVGQEHGFVIHDNVAFGGEVQEEGITISASKEILRDIAKGKGPEHYLVALGYSGWEAGQLELEIQRNDWLVAPFDPSILFSTSIDRRWVNAAKLLGIDINRLSDQIGHA